MEFTSISVWHDREVRVDAVAEDVRLIPGEFVLENIKKIEDAKGHAAQMVCLSRFVPSTSGFFGGVQPQDFVDIDKCHTQQCIGWSCVSDISIVSDAQSAVGRTNEMTFIMKIMATSAGNALEFLFSGPPESSASMSKVRSVLMSYRSTLLYRDLKLRGAIMTNGVLDLLPVEQVLDKIDGILNLSSEQGNLGVMYLTTVRVVWHASAAPNFNVSIPYFQIKTARLKPSKFGQVLVLEVYPHAGGYVLGFKVDPPGKLNDLAMAVSRLFETHAKSPFFGIPQPTEKIKLTQPVLAEPGVESEEEERVDAFAAYHVLDEATKNAARPPVYNETLGLAIESMISGVTLSSLWDVTNLSPDTNPLKSKIQV